MFEQPLSEKMKHLRNEKHRGYTYTPILDELLDLENQFKGLFFATKFHLFFSTGCILTSYIICLYCNCRRL